MIVFLYEFNDDGPIGSDSEYETLLAKMARVAKRSAYKLKVDGLESLAIGQVLDNVNHFRRFLEIMPYTKGSNLRGLKMKVLRLLFYVETMMYVGGGFMHHVYSMVTPLIFKHIKRKIHAPL